jgi:hypothetical protein
MPSLNFEKAKGASAVAVVRGGEQDGDILYLHPEIKTGSGSKTVDAVNHMKELNFLKPTERVKVMKEIAEHVEKDTEPEAFLHTSGDGRIKDAYKTIKEATNKNTAIILPDDSSFQPIPNPDPSVRQIWYVAGISGSGKSYFAKGIAENYKKLFPEREIYLVSKYNVDEDDTLGKMKVGKPKSISLDSIVDDYPSIDEFENCLIIFDDYDTLDAPYDKVVQKLIDDLAIRGRHTATSMCVLSHYLTNYKKTRLILGESHYIVLYPMATSFKAMKYVCEHHCGLTKDEVQSLKKLGRWVCIHKTFPQYLISAHTSRLLNQ